jgi:hypothetical protein
MSATSQMTSRTDVDTPRCVFGDDENAEFERDWARCG